jgi:hypothetical protein
MAAVYLPSLKDLQKVLKCTDQEMMRLGRRMSEAVIAGSMTIWRHHLQGSERNMMPATNEILEEEVSELNRAEAEASARRETGRGVNDDGAEENNDRNLIEMMISDGEEEDESMGERENHILNPDMNQVRENESQNLGDAIVNGVEMEVQLEAEEIARIDDQADAQRQEPRIYQQENASQEHISEGETTTIFVDGIEVSTEEVRGDIHEDR